MMKINDWSSFLTGGLLLFVTSCNNYPIWQEGPNTEKLAILQKQQQKIAKKMVTQYKKHQFQIEKPITKHKTSHSHSQNKKISRKSFVKDITFPCDMLFSLQDSLDAQNKKILLRCSNIALKEKASGIILRPFNLSVSKKILIQAQGILKKNNILHISVQPEKSFFLHKKNTFVKKESHIIMIDLDFQEYK